MKERLLALLQERDFVSGGEAARILGVSRTAVWKAVHRLQQDGHAIETAANKGYRLRGYAPFDKQQAASELAARGLHAALHWCESSPSTNSWAMNEAEDGAPAFSWYVADRQSAGRGRLGRAWVSPPGRNLYASCVLRPSLPPARASQLSLAVAVAVHRAVSALGVDARIKWPNDIHVNGRKLAGILCELRADPDRIDALVAGIGINVGMRADEFPPDLATPPTSLQMEGFDPDRTRLFVELAAALEAVVGLLETSGFAALRDEWNRACALHGKQVEVLFGEESRAGTVAGLDEDGYLILEHAGGCERIVAGDVTVKK